MVELKDLSIPPDLEEAPPLFSGNPHTNPFETMTLSGSLQAYPEKAKELVRAVQVMERRFASMTVVLPDIAGQPPKSFFKKPEIQARFGRRPFYITDETGAKLYIVRSKPMRFEELGEFSGETEYYRSKRWEQSPRLMSAIASSLPSFVNCADGALIFATGAGLGAENVILNKHTKEVGGLLVCHDVVPTIAAKAKRTPGMEDIPYAILPPHPDYLAPLLRSHQGPRIIFGHNLLSAFSLDSIDGLLATADLGGVSRIVLSQEANFAGAGIGHVPDELVVGGRDFIKLFTDSLSRLGIEEEKVGRNGRLIPAQARLTQRGLAWEMIRAYVTHVAIKKYGFSHVEVYLQEYEELVSKETARVNVSHSEDLLLALSSGNFNTITFAPFGEQYELCPRVPDGFIKRKGLHWIFSISKEAERNISGGELESDTGVLIPPEEPLTPAHMRFLDRRFAETRGDDDPDGSMRRLIATITHDIMFRHFAVTSAGQRFAKRHDLNLQALGQTLKESFCGN